jgi:hypothetical protein
MIRACQVGNLPTSPLPREVKSHIQQRTADWDHLSKDLYAKDTSFSHCTTLPRPCHTGKQPQCYCLFPSSAMNGWEYRGLGPALQDKRTKDALCSCRKTSPTLALFFYSHSLPCWDLVLTRVVLTMRELTQPEPPWASGDASILVTSGSASLCTSGGFDPRALLCGRQSVIMYVLYVLAGAVSSVLQR